MGRRWLVVVDQPHAQFGDTQFRCKMLSFRVGLYCRMHLHDTHNSSKSDLNDHHTAITTPLHRSALSHVRGSHVRTHWSHYSIAPLVSDFISSCTSSRCIIRELHHTEVISNGCHNTFLLLSLSELSMDDQEAAQPGISHCLNAHIVLNITCYFSHILPHVTVCGLN